MYIIDSSKVLKEHQKEIHHSAIITNEDMHKNLSQIIEIYHNLVVINTTNFYHSLIQIHQLPNISLTSNL